MKTIFLFLACLSLLFTIGCTGQLNTTAVCENEIKIDPEQILDSVPFSEIFKKISYIKIQTDDNFLVGRIDKLVVGDDRVFMLDRKLSRAVFCVDTNGKKVFEIHRIGRGPGEFMDLRDMAYDFRRKEILLFCYVRQMIISFDLQGNYLRERKMPFEAIGFQPLENGGFALSCDYNPEKKLKKEGYYPNIILTDSNMNVIAQDAYFKGEIDKSVVWSTRPDFSCFGKIAGIMPDHCNTIYRIHGDSITPAWKLDFGTCNIDGRYWEKTMMKGMTLEKLEEYCQAEGICQGMYYMENEKALYFAYRYKSRLYHAFYSKETGRLIATGKLVNDLNRFGGFVPQDLHRGRFYGHISAGTVYDYREKLKERKVMPDSILETTEMSDNPILVVYSLKSF